MEFFYLFFSVAGMVIIVCVLKHFSTDLSIKTDKARQFKELSKGEKALFFKYVKGKIPKIEWVLLKISSINTMLALCIALFVCYYSLRKLNSTGLATFFTSFFPMIGIISIFMAINNFIIFRVKTRIQTFLPTNNEKINQVADLFIGSMRMNRVLLYLAVIFGGCMLAIYFIASFLF